MRANQKPRRRHSEEFKAQVLAACGDPGASVSAVALSFGLNSNLVHQWRRGRGYAANRPAAAETASDGPPQFVALSLPASVPPPPAAAATGAAAEAIHAEIRRGALLVSVNWPMSRAGECAAWLRELLR